jgi:hypothetical protein
VLVLLRLVLVLLALLRLSHLDNHVYVVILRCRRLVRLLLVQGSVVLLCCLVDLYLLVQLPQQVLPASLLIYSMQTLFGRQQYHLLVIQNLVETVLLQPLF